MKLDKLLVPMYYYTNHYRYQVLHVITSVVPKTSCHSDVTLFGSFGLPTKEPYTVLIESVFKKQSVFLCFLSQWCFFSWKTVFSAFFFIKMCVFFNNDGKNYCLYSNLLQFPYSSKCFCLTLLGILTHIYIMITLVVIYHYCNNKCGKEA